MDAFYASVEIRERPELRGRPVIVGGSPDGRGVVCSASYEARRFGVRSAMACSRAAKICPEAEFVYPNFDLYSQVSREIRQVFHEVTDLVEPLSLDEAYLDVTSNKQSEKLAGKIAQWIRAEIVSRTGLTASAGVAPNKLVAKIASDLKKPNGLTIVPPERVLEVLAPLSVGRLWGVGPKTEERLNELGYFKVDDLRRSSREVLRAQLGGFGEELWNQAHGRDDRAVDPHDDPKSRGSETTFSEDVREIGKLLDVLDRLAEDVASDLARLGRPARTITVKIRYSNFETITRSQTLFRPTAQARTIAKTARELLFRDTEVGQRPVRLLGISASGLVSADDGPEQLWLDLELD